MLGARSTVSSAAALVFDLWCDRVYGEGMPVEIGSAPACESRSATGAA